MARSHGCFQLLRRRSGYGAARRRNGLRGQLAFATGCRLIFLRSTRSRLLLHIGAFRQFDSTVRQIEQRFGALQTVFVFDHFLLFVRRRLALLRLLNDCVRFDRRFDHNVLLDRRWVGGNGDDAIVADGLNVAAADDQVGFARRLATIYKDRLSGDTGQRGGRYGNHVADRFDRRTTVEVVVIGGRIADQLRSTDWYDGCIFDCRRRFAGHTDHRLGGECNRSGAGRRRNRLNDRLR